MSNAAQLAPQPMPRQLMPLQIPAIKRRYVRQQWIFVALGLIVVLNLNALGQRILGISQMFSPLILLLCVFAWQFSNDRSWARLPHAAKALIFGMGFFALTAFASGFHLDKSDLAQHLVSITSSIILLFAVSLLVRSLYTTGGSQAINFVVTAGYFLALLPTISIYIPLIYPSWPDLMGISASHRFSGVFANPNGAAAAALGFWAFAFSKTAVSRNVWWLAAAAPITAIAIYYTGSRTGFFGMIILSMILSWMVFPPKMLFRAAGVLLVVGLVIYGLMSYVRNQVDEGGYTRNIKRWSGALAILDEGRVTDETTAGRVTLTTVALEYWWEEPLVGQGLGSYRPMPIGLGPHNAFLVILGESGLLGFIPYMYAWIMFFVLALRPRDRTVRTFVLSIFLALSMAAMTSHSVFLQKNNVFFLAVALAVAGLAPHALRAKRPRFPHPATNRALPQPGPMMRRQS